MEPEMTEEEIKKEYEAWVANDPVYGKLCNSIVGLAIARHFHDLARREATVEAWTWIHDYATGFVHPDQEYQDAPQIMVLSEYAEHDFKEYMEYQSE